MKASRYINQKTHLLFVKQTSILYNFYGIITFLYFAKCKNGNKTFQMIVLEVVIISYFPLNMMIQFSRDEDTHTLDYHICKGTICVQSPSLKKA